MTRARLACRWDCRKCPSASAPLGAVAALRRRDVRFRPRLFRCPQQWREGVARLRSATRNNHGRNISRRQIAGAVLKQPCRKDLSKDARRPILNAFGPVPLAVRLSVVRGVTRIRSAILGLIKNALISWVCHTRGRST